MSGDLGNGVGVVTEPSSPSEVNHVAKLLDSLKGSVLLNVEYADVFLVVEGVKLPAHKNILAARSEYFRTRLLEMKQSNVNQVELEGASIAGLKALLEYLYTGQLTLTDLSEDVLLDVLRLCHECQGGFKELVNIICEYLRGNLQVENVCRILDTALALGLHMLISACCNIGDENSVALLQHSSFCSLSPAGITKLISRDSFFAEEDDIFDGVASWTRNNLNVHQEASTVMQISVRLELMKPLTLLERVKPTGFVTVDAIHDAIILRKKNRSELKYRGHLVPEENVAHKKHGATIVNVLNVTRGSAEAILDGDAKNYDAAKGYGSHIIDLNKNEGIVIKLGQQYILNHVRMLLWDLDLRSYSYFVEVSIDEKYWVRICDYTKYHCRSWQDIFFMQRAVRFIRIVGTLNVVNQWFHLVQVEAYFTAKTFPICPEFGLLCPKENVAMFDLGARVIGGILPKALINGKTEGYDRHSGYTYHEMPTSGGIVVQLAQPYVMSSMRLLLWDGDDRSYSYRVEVSTDKSGWKMVWDMSEERCKSWQTLRFSPIPVVYVRIVGTFNSKNTGFHCVHLECPAQTDEGATIDNTVSSL